MLYDTKNKQVMYVGSTMDCLPFRRFAQHQDKGDPWDKLDVITLERLPEYYTKKQVLQVEQCYIDSFGTLRNGLNKATASVIRAASPQHMG